MPRIECRCCSNTIHVSDYDFARWSKGEFVLCEQCYTDWKNNKSKIRRF